MKKRPDRQNARIPDHDRYVMSPAETAAAAVKILGVLSLISFAFYDSLLPVLFLAGPALFFFLKKERIRLMLRQKELLKRQFLSAGSLLCDELKSGYSVENAMQKSLAGLRELWGDTSLIAAEWETILRETALGTPVETGFLRFSKRAGIEEIRDFAEAFATVKRTGGQLVEVLTAATELIADRFRTEEQIRTMIRQKQLEQHVMDVMPAAILLYVRFGAPELTEVLYTTLLGRLVMTGCLAVYAAAFFWAEKIVKIEA